MECSTCRFAGRAGNDITGTKLECRFKPPVAVPMQAAHGLAVLSLSPPVQPDHWCGEWAARVVN